MVKRISDRSAAGGPGFGGAAATAGTPAMNGNGPTRNRILRTFPMDVRRIATPDEPHQEYSTRSREVARAPRGLELGAGACAGEPARAGGGPDAAHTPAL